MTGHRRAIACTICAKAKTKCDKAVPSCSRCTAKGLVCEARSTRRTTDNVYRQAKKQLVSHKRFSSTSSIPSAGRESPRSVPGPDQKLSHTSQPMDIPSPAKFGLRQAELSGMPSLTPLSPFSSGSVGGSVSDVYSDYGSPDPGLSMFPPLMDNGDFDLSGSLTPQTPDSFCSGGESLPLITDSFDQYLNPQLWADDSQIPMGLGFGEAELPDLMATDPTMQSFWPSSDLDPSFANGQMFPTRDTPTLCDSPTSLPAWSMPPSSVSPSTHHPHTRPMPSLSMSESTVPEVDSMLAFRDEWPCFRCNPSEPIASELSTSKTYLQGLEAIPKNPNVWRDSIQPQAAARLQEAFNNNLRIESLRTSTRDALMTATREMLRKARVIFESSDSSLSPSTSRSTELDQGFATSPSTTTLEFFFKSYSCRFEPYYPNFSAGVLDPMELLTSDNKSASSLLLLLILAAGASATPTMEAGYLTNGLTESCRILLTDLTDNDISLWKNPTILRSALLSMNLAAWSGEKWHMDVAKSQSDLYLTMLRRSGLFAYRQNSLSEFCGILGSDVEWKTWKQHESMNRLVYSWVIADQELSLFHDQAPNLAITELTAALPDKEVLWQASSADNWSLALATVYDDTEPNQTKTPPSLFDLFKRLMSRDLLNESRDLTKLQLRLLLHPLQALVCHLHQCLSCFAGDASSSHAQRLFVQIREVQSILQDWYALCCKRMRSVEDVCPILLSNLVMYHLVCLNTMAHFPDIEAVARGEVSHEQFLSTSWARTNSVGSASRIWFHCGQIIRLVRMMPEPNRPLWFPAVIYRVALILWMVSTCNNATQAPANPLAGSIFAIDNLHPEAPSIARYLQSNEGTPMLSTRKGVLISFAVPTDTIMYCLEVLKEEEFNTRLATGIKNRLSHLAQRVKAISV